MAFVLFLLTIEARKQRRLSATALAHATSRGGGLERPCTVGAVELKDLDYGNVTAPPT